MPLRGASRSEGVADGLTVTTLPSGVRVVTEPMPDVRSVAVGWWVSVGSRDERGPVAGASHFLEHLLFKGTPRRTAAQIAGAIEAVGGDINAFTSKECTCFYARTLDRDLPLAVDVLGDLMTSSLIRGADVDAERRVVLEEIAMHTDTPDDLVHSVFDEALYGDHPLGREVLGDSHTIGAMTRAQVHRYYRRHYTPANLVVAVAGNVTQEQVVDLVGAAVDGWQPPEAAQPAATRRRAPRLEPTATAVVRKRPTEQAHLVLGAPGLARSDPRRYAAGVLNQALGGGMSSRLFQQVRERRGLAYSVYSYLGMHSDGGSFAVYAGTTPGQADEVLSVVRDELRAVVDRGLDPRELEEAKGHLAGATVLALEDTSSRMSRLGKALCTGAPLLSLDETLESIAAVDAEAVAALAAQLLSGPFSLALVGPFAAADRKRLARHAEPVAA